MVSTSHQASRPSWSTIASKTWPLYFSRFGTKDATSWRRRTTPSTENSVGSWILRATRLSFGSHHRGSELHAWASLGPRLNFDVRQPLADSCHGLAWELSIITEERTDMPAK